jgi:CheY-like chemotaxis protein
LDALNNIKVLYVEDEKFTRMLVTKMLEKAGMDVTEAANGMIGYKKFLEVSPDIIVTDLAMPEMDGFEMIVKIKSHNSDTPIIVTTAYREEAEKVNESVNECIYKPILKEDLLSAINKIIG